MPPVLLGDESTLSNDALPHSIEGGAPLLAIENDHQSLAREAAREADKLRKAGEELIFEEAPVKRVIIPENPYLENLNKFKLPSVDLLIPAEAKDLLDADDEELAMKGRILRDKLATFGVEIENITVTPGPVVTLYEFTPAEGVKVSRVENLTDDIALAMKARGIRIIAPIPGRGTIGVEIPNDVPKMVRMRQMLESESFRKTKMNLPVALGKTISGDVYVDDLNKMPHLLIAGATGAGKSVGVNGIIASLLYAKSPKDIKFVIVDPKKIELSLYKLLRKHYLIVSPEAGEDIVTTPAFAVLALKAVELEMERRYDKLAKAAVRSLLDYNIKVAQGKLQSTQEEQHYHLPYIVVIIDELADLMITAGKDIEEPICRIAQMARAVGIHLILATQRPSVDVITGVIKANFPARIAFQVATRVDSRTILDSMGAEQLLGNGDMLYQPSGTPKPIRLQSPFISTEEVEAIVEAISAQEGPGLSYSRPWTLPSLKQKDGRSSSAYDDGDGRDDLFEEAARVIVRHQQGSVSLLQRRLKVGYSRAARIVDELEQAAIVGPFDGSKARAVLCENEEELELVFEGLR
jgi:S-DNA-T family DNA segregation ATPase FtsK/SpoIIIE